MIGDFLFQLTPRDLQVTPLEFTTQQISQAGALAQINVDYTIPDGRVMWLQNSNLRSTPGGTQYTTDLYLMLLPPRATPGANNGLTIDSMCVNISTGSGLGYLEQGNSSSGGLPAVFNWHGGLLIPQGWTIEGRALFSAAVQTNILLIDLIGYLIPRGNISV